MAQDSLRCRRMAPKMLQDALITLQDSSKRPIISPRKPPKKPTMFQKPMIFGFSPFRFRWPSEASTWLQKRPRRPQEGPKRALRRPQERPRALQERPKRGPGGCFGSSRGA
eukprot:3045413-Pyramimonas_sp.AAC.1